LVSDLFATVCDIFTTLPMKLINMKYKNILVKELYSRKYRNRIKRSKKGKGSFKRLKKVKAEDWKKERERQKEIKKKEERRLKEVMLKCCYPNL